ncbi:hypothetical protein ACLOJK_013705 [Asimina triloba]
MIAKRALKETHIGWEVEAATVMGGVTLQEKLFVARAKQAKLEGQLHTLEEKSTLKLKTIEGKSIALQRKVVEFEAKLQHASRAKEASTSRGKASGLISNDVQDLVRGPALDNPLEGSEDEDDPIFKKEQCLIKEQEVKEVEKLQIKAVETLSWEEARKARIEISMVKELKAMLINEEDDQILEIKDALPLWMVLPTTVDLPKPSVVLEAI